MAEPGLIQRLFGDNGVFGESEEEKAARLLAEKQRTASGLLGQSVTTTGTMQGTEVFGSNGNPIFNEQSVVSQPQREGTGYLGSARTQGDLAGLNLGLTNVGYTPKEVSVITGGFKDNADIYKDQQKARADEQRQRTEQTIKQGNVLRKERGNDLKPFNEAKTQYNTTMNALQQDSGAGTLAAIFSFMKTLDPRSVVREGEFQMGTQTGGVVDSIVSMVNRAKGEGMGPEARRGIAQAIQAIMEGRVADAEAVAEQYDVIAREQGVPLSQIRTGAYNPELQGVPQDFLDQADPRYEYRMVNGKMQRRLK